MSDELTNLLPLDRLKVLRRHYFMRVFVVGALLVTLLIATSALLLLPTYTFLRQSEASKERTLAALSTSHSSANEKELIARLSLLRSNAKILTTLDDAPSMARYVSSIINAPRPGVTLSGFSYAPALTTPKKVPATLSVTGKAATREALRSFQLALQSVPSVASAALPVSAYAQSEDIPFTITLTLTP